MRKRNLVLAGLAVLGVAAAGAAAATPATMTFDTLGNGQQVASYYAGGCSTTGAGVAAVCGGPDWGVTWSVASVREEGVGLRGEPSSPNAIAFPGVAGTSTMNVAGGFGGSLGFYYASPGKLTTVTLFSGADGTGDTLASAQLPATGRACGGAGAFTCWNPFEVAFDGVAHSVVFGGPLTQVAFDNVSIHLDTGLANVPEPGAVGMFGFGTLAIAGVVALRRRRGIAG